MDELISRYLSGELTDLEAGRLRGWRRTSSENEARFQALVRAWELAGPELARGPDRPSGALEAVIAEAERRRGGRPAGRWAAAGWWTAAALAVLSIGGGLAGWHLARPGFGPAELSTGAGETVTVTLNDGSFVRMGPRSRLTVARSSNRREVWLEGRAYFAVAKDPDRPFRVRTRAGEAIALGTRFEVQVDQDELRLTVVDGRVALAAGGARIEVGPGEVSHSRRGAAPSVIKVEDVNATLDWPRGLLVFQATPLPEVARELERHFGVHPVLASPSLARRMVTAWFEDEGLGVVLTTVCRVTQTSCAVRGDTVTFSP